MNGELRQAIMRLWYAGVQYLVVDRSFYCRIVRYSDEVSRRLGIEHMAVNSTLLPEGITDEEIVERRLGDSITFRGRRLMMLEEDMALPLAQ